ncbi:MAG: efflux RND transporter periplasmic adaptor subunit [Deltaproteobacteria bacterium]|jgi:multidrug efflux pump subunit AcrA (membrane-fusion protein)|nr:efflux RND transporter periplasmic adaptor subunit [Deltaproteobacteria bacterium]
MTHPEDRAAGPGARFLSFARRHKKLSAVAVLFAGLTVFRLVSGQADGPPGFGPGGEAVYVELGQAEFGTMRELGLYYGTLSAPSRFSLAPRVGGELREILADIGDRLESGQVVAILDDEEYRLARDRAHLAVTLAQAQLDEASANLRLARNDMTRQETLSRKSVVAASELEAAENRLRQAEARQGVAESQLASARNQLADAELKLSYTRVTASWPASGAEGEGPASPAPAAPAAGEADPAARATGGVTPGYRYVGARLADTGALLAANTPIFDIVSLDPLLVVVEVIEKDYPRISVGMEASVRLEAFPGEAFKATVKRVAPVLSASSRQARVELEVPNPGLRLKPGMYAEVVFTFDRRDGVWSVAADVPYRKYDGHVIFVADPATGTVEERKVELGLREGDRVELMGTGPIDGPVVVMGQHLLRDGQAYRVPGAEPVPASGVEPSSARQGPGGLSPS